MITIENIHISISPRQDAMAKAFLAAILSGPVPPEDDGATNPTSTVPAIGQPWPGADGIYAGVSRGEDGEADAHLVLLNERPEAVMGWNEGMALAAARTDGALMPSRFESALLYAHLSDQFDASNWHWTRTQYSEDYAWRQLFYYGSQYHYHKKFDARVRFVRRFPL